MDLKDTYNLIAEDWLKDHKEDAWWIGGTEKFVSLLPHGGSVLDVGCGPGVKAAWLMEKGLRVTGTDLSNKMVEIAAREVPEAKFIVMDVRDTTELDERFDGVLAQAVLLHIPKSEIAAVVKNLARVLNAGGYLYVAVKEVREGGLEEETATENDYGYTYVRFFSYFSLPEIAEHLKDAGLTVVYEQVTRSGKTNWIQVIAQKRL